MTPKNKDDPFAKFGSVKSTQQDEDIRKRLDELLTKEAEEDHNRDRVTRSVIAICMWALTVLIFVIVAGSIVTLAWHLLLPGQRSWLDPEEIRSVKDFILSGAIVSLGMTFLRRHI